MSKNKTPKASEIELLKVKTFQSIIQPNNELVDNYREPQGFNFSIKNQIVTSHDRAGIRIRLNILLDAKFEQNSNLSLKGEFGIEFHFHIRNVEQYLEQIENGTIQYNNLAISTIIGIAYSTARGMILQQTQGSFLGKEGFLLPIVDPLQLLKNT